VKQNKIREVQMQTITGLYGNYDDARAVVNKLEEAGISSANIAIVDRDSETGETTYAGEGAATGAGVGAVVGGTGRLLAGVGLLGIAGEGPVVAAGWLVSTVAGAAAGAVAGGAAGGIIGSLTDAGVDEDKAHDYAEGIRRGSTLLSARLRPGRHCARYNQSSQVRSSGSIENQADMPPGSARPSLWALQHAWP
jgi:hypothetical protein